LKKRGVSGQLARDYRLGYAPPGYHNLPDVISRETMLAAGLVTAKGGGPSYDWFRDRIMYPIRDRRGRIVGFGGRVIGSGTPKYLNSPESAIFKKSREVYGLYELLNAVRAPEFVLVVEGYMDVIALAQHGITNAVATLGTATSPDHVKLLFRYTRDLVFCFDGDAAGRAAAFKAMQSSLPLLRDGWQVRILTLPEGHDPDSLVREEGKQRFLERTRLAQPLSEFFFERLAEGLNLASLEGRAALVAKAQPLIEKLHPGVFRSLVEQRLSELVGRRWIEKIDKPSMLDAGGRYENSVRKHVKSAVHSFLTLLVTFPHLSRELDFEAKARLTGIEKYGPVIRKVIDYIATAPNATSAGILEAFRGQPEEQYIARLMAAGGQLQSDGAATIADEFRDYVRYLTDFRSKVDRLELLIEKSRKAVLSAEEREELRSLTSV
jgi:DNA primase